MIIDDTMTLVDDADFFGAAATANIGDILDIGTDGAFHSNLQGGLLLQITEAMVGGTSAQFQLVSDSTDTIATNGDQTIHAVTNVYLVAELTLGKRIFIPIPQGDTFERYLALQVTRVGTSTEGEISAFILKDAQMWRAYADAVD
jgi:hypothetical protein